MGDQILPKKNAVSDELAELIDRKIRENQVLLKLIGKLNNDTAKASEANNTKLAEEKK